MQQQGRGFKKADRGLTSRSWLRINWKGMKCQACFRHSETVKTLPPPPSYPPSSSSSRQLVTHQTVSPLTSRPWQPPTAMTKLLSSVQRFALQSSPDISMQNKTSSLATGSANETARRVFTCCQTVCLLFWTMACQCAAFCWDPKRALGVTQVFRFEGS